MNADRFFKILGRINAIGLFIALLFIAYMAVRDFVMFQAWEDDFEPYGNEASKNGFKGGEIKTATGGMVSYLVEPTETDGLEVKGANLSFTNMKTGASRLVLPDGGPQIILNSCKLELPDETAVGYLVFSGTEADYKTGLLDLTLGRFADLEQKTIARRLHFVDSPRMLDADTMSVIVWPSADRAEFWIVDFRTFAIVQRRAVALPLPSRDDATQSAAEAAGEAAEDAAAGVAGTVS